MGRFLVFLGLVLAGGSVAYFLQEFEASSTAYYKSRGTFGQQVSVGWETGKQHMELLAWLVLELCVAGWLIIGGRKKIADEKSRRESPAVEASETDNGLPDLPDRLGNPFKRGEASETVLPRGQFLKNRNKFRKTIERPNSEGY